MAFWWLLLVAPCVGSFLGVLIRRLPVGAPVVLARSCCGRCGVVLRPVELVPLLSFAWLGGACRACGARIGWFHPAVELAAFGVAGVALAVDPPRAWAVCGLGWPLLVLGWIDAETMRLPDVLSLPLLGAGLAACWWFAPWELGDHLVGAAVGWGGLAAVAAVYRWWRGVDGLGSGDPILLAVGGAWLGWQALPQVVLVAAIGGICWACVRRMGRDARMPFGPFLSISIWMIYLAAA